MKNRTRETCTSGSVRDEDGNVLIYSANDRGDRGNVGIIRSPIRASILPDPERKLPSSASVPVELSRSQKQASSASSPVARDRLQSLPSFGRAGKALLSASSSEFIQRRIPA